MRHLPSPVKSPSTTTLLLLLIPVALAGCTSNNSPTSTEAGQMLKSHVLQLLNERNAQSVIVQDPGGKNIACADGKVKQTFAATGSDVASDTTSENMRSALVGALARVAPYKLIDVGSLTRPVHVQNTTARTNLVLDSPSKGIYAVSGETDCLAP